jgi:hypothetical protein
MLLQTCHLFKHVVVFESYYTYVLNMFIHMNKIEYGHEIYIHLLLISTNETSWSSPVGGLNR